MDGSLDHEEYELLREAASTIRERLIVRLVGEAGLSPSEQTRIRPGDVERRRIENSTHRFLPVYDDSGEITRKTYLSADLARLIDEYAATTGTDSDSRLLDVTPRRVQMLVSEVAGRAAERSDDERFETVSSNDLRRYFTRRLLVEEGMNPRIVRTVGGWNRLGALEPYVDQADESEIAAAFGDTNGSTRSSDGISFGQNGTVVGLELDADGRIIGTDGDVAGLLGYGSTEVVGTPFGRLFAEADRERTRPRNLLDAAERDGVEVETCWLSDDGGAQIRLTALVCARRENDRLEGFTVVLRDSTTDEEGDRSASVFREAVTSAGQPISFVSTSGKIAYVNEAFEDLVGYSQSEVTGRAAADILSSGEDREDYLEKLRDRAQERDRWSAQVTIRRKSGERVHVRQTVAPFGRTADETDFLIVVATDVTERVRRERSLARRCETLEGLESLVADINAAGREIIDASTRPEIEAAVCSSLADSDAYLEAWIGGKELGDPRLQPREWSRETDLEGSAITMESAALSAALDSDNPRMTGGEFPPDVLGPFDRDAVSSARTAAVIPLAYGETTYGALVVFTERKTAFGDRERTLLSDLGDRIGHTITAIERRNLLLADTVVELEFECTDRNSFLVDATAEHDCICTIQAVVPVAEGSLLFYTMLSGAPPDAFLDTATAPSGVIDGRYVREHDDRSLLELTVEGNSPALTLTEIGATIREGTADAGTLTLRTEVAQDTGVRSVVEGVQTTFPQTNLRAKQAIDRAVETVEDFQDSLTERLTDKQHAALRAAYFAGYFDWPRGSTAEEVADSMGVSSPTLHNHLRKAERKLLSSFFDQTKAHIGQNDPKL